MFARDRAPDVLPLDRLVDADLAVEAGVFERELLDDLDREAPDEADFFELGRDEVERLLEADLRPPEDDDLLRDVPPLVDDLLLVPDPDDLVAPLRLEPPDDRLDEPPFDDEVERDELERDPVERDAVERELDLRAPEDDLDPPDDDLLEPDDLDPPDVDFFDVDDFLVVGIFVPPLLE